jgi:hypothetical protein
MVKIQFYSLVKMMRFVARSFVTHSGMLLVVYITGLLVVYITGPTALFRLRDLSANHLSFTVLLVVYILGPESPF